MHAKSIWHFLEEKGTEPQTKLQFPSVPWHKMHPLPCRPLQIHIRNHISKSNSQETVHANHPQASESGPRTLSVNQCPSMALPARCERGSHVEPRSGEFSWPTLGILATFVNFLGLGQPLRESARLAKLPENLGQYLRASLGISAQPNVPL